MAQSNQDLQIPRRPLGNTGLHVSVLGFGASPLGGVFAPIDQDAGIQAVHRAFQRGINFYDTSPYYGDTKSEAVLGKGLVTLPRDQIIVCSKAGRYGSGFDFSAQRITASVQESLTRLNLSYLDIVHAHDIEFADLNQIINETLPALCKLRDEGIIRHVGISGLPLKIFKIVLDAVPPGTVDVVLSYCHHTLADSTLVNNLVPYLKEKGVGVINASPLSMGLFTPQGPPDWHPAPQQLKAAASRAAEICEKNSVSLPALAIKHAVKSCDDIATHLVGLCTPDQVDNNVDTALAALGVVVDNDDNDKKREQEVEEQLVRIFGPVMGMTWPSGREENN